MGLDISQIKTGTYTGTGAAQTITLGFKPTLILFFNQTDGDTAGFYINGMTAATAAVMTGAVAADTNAITTSATGFSLGTSSVSNENTKVYYYFAIGGVDGSA
jgi:hypothetical protein